MLKFSLVFRMVFECGLLYYTDCISSHIICLYSSIILIFTHTILIYTYIYYILMHSYMFIQVNTLLIIDVHARDIVDGFVRESVLNAKEFAWESQVVYPFVYETVYEVSLSQHSNDNALYYM